MMTTSSHGWRATARVLAGLIVAGSGTFAVPSIVVADTGSTTVTDAERDLAERHVPVMMLQTQPEECSPDGEPFLPMPVEAVLDNPEIALRQLGPDGLVVRWAPTAADLYSYGPNFYLDFPGSALAPGCSYERDMRRYLDDRDLGPTVYAHVATSSDEPGVIALQYWFYWYFNDWNNKHESDWEGIQLLFRASSAEEALAVEPFSVGYAQHTGGERADWNDAKLERDGQRPVVYTSARSHASYFSDEIYLGRGASEGFGCDNTTGPSTRVDPQVVPLPARVDDPAEPLAWLEFEGRWGERHGGAYDSPTGLQSKSRWNDPVAWHAGLRDGSVAVPAGDSAAGDVIDAFCNVVQWGSGQALLVQLSPLRVLISIMIVAVALRFLLGRTSWRRVPATPVVQRRRGGEIARAAVACFRSDPLTFLGLGTLAIPVIVAAGAAVGVARALPLVGNLIELSDTGGSSRLAASAVTGGIATSVAFVFVVAAVGFVLARADAGVDTDVVTAIAAVRSRAWPLVGVVAVAFLAVMILASTVLLAPVAAWLLVRWQLAAPATMIEQRSTRDGLLRSMQLTRRRWWHTLVVTGVINLTVLGAGLVVGLVVLTVFSSLPLWSLTAVVAAVGAVVMPIGAIAVTLLYGDARAQADDRADDVALAAAASSAGSPSR
jgi:hypothetical protein